HPQIGKRVALKLLHPELASSAEIVERFLHEARAVNDIGHQNIVDVLDFGMHGPLAYLVMELVDGETLSAVLAREQQLAPARALAIAAQIADALAAAHACGIVHRDLKPDNVMLRAGDVVKLLDFGVAKRNLPGGTKTRTGMVIGTPTYMS